MNPKQTKFNFKTEVLERIVNCSKFNNDEYNTEKEDRFSLFSQQHTKSNISSNLNSEVENMSDDSTDKNKIFDDLRSNNEFVELCFEEGQMLDDN